MDNPSSAGFMELARLQELISNGSPAQLEAGVEAGLQILSDTRVAFADAMALPEVSDWIKQSCQLESQAEHQRIVVGVVGSTGAGKSSVINAVLEEEGLVPTNCMRACTAVITEISHNTSTLEGEKYRAEIHFISKDEWVKELRVMLADMETGQVSLGAGPSISESEAGIAYQKIRSVYPFLRGDEVKNGTFDLDELTEQPSVKVLLGTVEKLASSNPKDFLSRLKRFIDSKEKTAGGTKEPDAMEYWPLIKVVKVFVRSPILKSGLVLVDLVGDSIFSLTHPVRYDCSSNEPYSLASMTPMLRGLQSPRNTLSNAVDCGLWRLSLEPWMTRSPKSSLVIHSNGNCNSTALTPALPSYAQKPTTFPSPKH